MRKNINSVNFKKKFYSKEPKKNSSGYKLYHPTENIGSSTNSINLNSMQSPFEYISIPNINQRENLKELSKEDLTDIKMELILEYREGIKEIEKIEPQINELWSIFDFEKNIMSMELGAMIKEISLSRDNLHIEVLLEGLHYFFNQIGKIYDLVEVPAAKMVGEITKNKFLGILSDHDTSLKSSTDSISKNHSVILSKSVQILLKICDLKDLLNQKFMIQKICENKHISVNLIDQMIKNLSLQKKKSKQIEKIKEFEGSLKSQINETNYFKQTIQKVIERDDEIKNEVKKILKLSESSNININSLFQTMNSQSSPPRFKSIGNNFHSQMSYHTKGSIMNPNLISKTNFIDSATQEFFAYPKSSTENLESGHPKKDLSLIKENPVEVNYSKNNTLSSPLKFNLVLNQNNNSDKGLQTPKALTFAQLSIFTHLKLI
jgi:hypothetical protein